MVGHFQSPLLSSGLGKVKNLFPIVKNIVYDRSREPARLHQEGHVGKQGHNPKVPKSWTLRLRYAYASDVWSFGITLYEMAQLVPPFKGANICQVGVGSS